MAPEDGTHADREEIGTPPNVPEGTPAEGRRLGIRRWLVPLAAFLAAGTLAWLWQRPARGPVRLAVLPFGNLTGDAGEDYLVDGFTEEIIARVGELQGGIAVIARTSVRKYSLSPATVRQIGDELHVQYVLEGSLRKAADRFRVTTQLIRVSDETHVWTQTYDSSGSDTLAVQEDLARRVARSVGLQLVPGTISAPPPSRPVDPEAHLDYLRGRYFADRRTQADLRKAVESYKKALSEDSSYAAAYAGLADALSLLSPYGNDSASDTARAQREAVEKALALDGNLAEARTSLASLLMDDWDWAAAEREFRRAIELNPSYSTAHHWYGLLLNLRGRSQEALEEVRQARDLDPLSLGPNFAMGVVRFCARDYKGATAEFRRSRELYPGFPGNFRMMGRTLIAQGREAEAIHEVQEGLRLAPGNADLLATFAYIEAIRGRKAESARLLQDLEKLPSGQAASLFQIAWVQMALGERDQALQGLERALSERSPHLPEIKVAPELDPLRSEARFQNIVHRIGLPD